MNRRHFLTGAAAIGGVAGVIHVANPLYDRRNRRLRIALSSVVPNHLRANDLSALQDHLRQQLSPRTKVSIEQVPSDWRRVNGLSDGTYDVVELGAIAGTVVTEADAAIPLVQPQLAGGWEYDGQLLVDNAFCSQPTETPWLAVKTPLSTATQGALAAMSTSTTPPLRTRWHNQSPAAALSNEKIQFAASNTFDSPSDATVDRSYPLPVPSLYIRHSHPEITELRSPFLSAEGGHMWYSDIRQEVQYGFVSGWFHDAEFIIN